MSGHVVVIGGGITGLAAVEQLTREAPRLRVTLLEGSARLGGHIRTDRQDGFVMEAGPDVLLAAKPAAIELAARVGLGSRLRGTSPTARGSYIWSGDRLVRLPDGMTGLVPSRMLPFARTPLLSPVAKLRVALEYFIPARREDDDESVEAFVVRRLGRAMYERLAEPLLSGISAGDGARLSMATMFPQLRALEREHGSLIRGMLAARRKRGAQQPATGSLSPFVSFPTGLSELVEAVVDTVTTRDPAGERVALRTGALVARVTRDAESETFSIELTNGETLTAHSVIVAAPAYMASMLLRPIDGELSNRLAEIDYESTVTVSLAYPVAAVPRPLDATGYVVPRRLHRPALACTWASAKFEGRAPQEYALFRVFLGGAQRAVSVHAPDSELRTLATGELAEVMGIRDEPVLCRINRFERAMPQYYVGHLKRVEEIEGLTTRVPGLYLAGAAYGGVGIPDCVRSGERAATRALHAITEHTSLLVSSRT
jgi:protoporphyrinogen/coproporphyrinogen III oxidase